MIKLLRKMFFIGLILLAVSLVSFGQTSDEKKTPKPTPPKIVIPPEKKPSDGKKPNGYVDGDFRITSFEDH